MIKYKLQKCTYKSETSLSIDLSSFNKWNIYLILIPLLAWVYLSPIIRVFAFRVLKVYGPFFLRMKFNISFMVGQVNGDLGVVYHKVTFCVIKCILESEYTLLIVWWKHSFGSRLCKGPVQTWTSETRTRIPIY